ncbi:class F sortase [Wenjunlia tyrosinilytica]|uniref:Class F sortase n=1 Tax=Wenjunlia tyrosinilytica TaxID=1544741 RepID=A0A918DWQ2_9ACTN|nr:class F sortase [Wenjunlia tyrosinilytica]GGO87116.1 hypothetical protein GCM10012280_24860 [Wenjunlia tyrosinilytica]
MANSSQHAAGPRRGRRPLYIGSAVLALVAVALIVVAMGRQDPAPPQGPAAQQQGQQGQHQGHDSARAGTKVRGTVLKASAPEQISIPSLNVSSSLERLGLDAKQAMQTPRDPDKAGWFTPGPTPGALGPSVIAGHVTWNGSPGVFFRLAQMKKGDTVEVGRQDGTTAVFTVDRTARYAKERFPTIEVYRNLDHAGLRLITCGGDFSAKAHHYADNIVVFAHLTGTKAA